MIYIVIALLTVTALTCLILKSKSLISIVIISGSIFSILLLSISLAPEVRTPVEKHLLPFSNLFNLLPYSSTSTTLFALIMALITFYELTFFYGPKTSDHHLPYSPLLLFACITGGIFIFTNNIYLIIISIFAFPVMMFFSRIFKRETGNFSYLFWSIIGTMSFLIASVYLLNTAPFEEFDLTKLISMYFQPDNNSNPDSLLMTPSAIISALFFVTIIFTNFLFPLSYIFSRDIEISHAGSLFLYHIYGIIFISLIIKLKLFNPLVIDLISIFILINIIISSAFTIKSRSLKNLIFHTDQLLLCFIAAGTINYSESCFNATLYFIFLSTLIFICIVFTLSLFEKKNINSDINNKKSFRLMAPKACLSISVLIVIFTIPAGPYFFSTMTMLREISISSDIYLMALPLVFLTPFLTGIYIIYRLFFTESRSEISEDISLMDLSPIIPVLVIIILIILKFTNILPSHPADTTGVM